ARHENVFRDAEIFENDRLLVNDAYSHCLRGQGGGDVDAFATPLNAASIRLMDTSEYLDQGGLAGAIFAHQRRHRSGVELQVDVRKRQGSAEALAQSRDAQQHWFTHLNSSEDLGEFCRI